MLPYMHALLGAIFALAILPLPGVTPLAAIIIFLAAVFIDIDHYLPYAIARREFSLKKAYHFYKKLPLYHPTILNLLHTLEIFILLIILGIFFPFFLYIFIGFVFHSLFDLTEMIQKRQLLQREYSLINYLLKRGSREYLDFKTFDPERFYKNQDEKSKQKTRKV